jgi:dolichyl-phosphate beta-glucosyltransferase
LIERHIHDTQCGFKLFRADVGKRLFSSLHLSGWAFDIELVLLARILRKRIAEVPVTWIEMPGSKLNLVCGHLTMLRDIVLLKLLYCCCIWRPCTFA